MDYSVLTWQQIYDLPVECLAADKCHLYLWMLASPKYYERSIDACEAWGFVPKAEIIWVKMSATGCLQKTISPHVRYAHEKCIFATRGRHDINEGRIPSVLIAPRRRLVGTSRLEHSGKPDEFFSMIERLSYAPRIELFARAKRNDWDVWGKEAQ